MHSEYMFRLMDKENNDNFMHTITSKYHSITCQSVSFRALDNMCMVHLRFLQIRAFDVRPSIKIFVCCAPTHPFQIG